MPTRRHLIGRSRASLRFARRTIAIAIAVTAWASPAHADAARVEALLTQLTLEEKATLLGGVDDFYTRPIPRLNIPRIAMSDGPNGVHPANARSTAYPAGVLLAATWDPSLAAREGQQLGRDARARGVHVLLAPGMNMYRHPRNGRNFEYFGEDPLLCGEIAVGYVRGLQSQGVSGVIKHFIADNQETDRFEVTTEIDERTIRERYLPAFKRVIDLARPGAVMCSYNRVNGTYASANKWLINDVLREEWKFDGPLMSDWGATHGTIAPLNAGLDLEMPDPRHLNPKKVVPLVRNGVVTEATIDAKVRRLLNWMDRFGWLDKSVLDKSIPLDNPDGAAVALEVARAGLTLLKNDGNLLPLDPATVKRVVVLGPGAVKTPVGGGGSGNTRPFQSVSIAEGLTAALGADRVTVVIGDALEKLVYQPAVDGGVFKAEYFNNKMLDGTPAVTTTVNRVDFEGLPDEAVRWGPFSARFSTTLTPAGAAEYTFFAAADDGVRVLLDGKPILDDWSEHVARAHTTTVRLEAGRRYDLAVEYYDDGGDAVLHFGCGPKPAAYDEAERAAVRDADAVIACVGYGPRLEGEGFDRTYRLPEGQDEIIVKAAAENPKTIVVLNAGGSCDLTQWGDRVPALLHAYYAGQEGGTAIADVLLGNVNPSGRLPFTFEKKQEDLLSNATFGRPKVAEYAEGVFAGYRGLDRDAVEPRFPFGFGLSYTTFDVSNGKATVGGEDVVVSVDITNTGRRDGATVVQCYAEPPPANVPRPVRELRAFTKPTLKAGEKRSIELRFKRNEFAYWDPATRQWTVAPGAYTLRLGKDSRTLPVSVRLDIASDQTTR